jgi:hypothetical protein
MKSRIAFIAASLAAALGAQAQQAPTGDYGSTRVTTLRCRGAF